MAGLAAYPRMLAEDRRSNGFKVGQVAWRLGITPADYLGLEAGEPIHDETSDRIFEL